LTVYKKENTPVASQESYCIGTKIGKCDICRVTKKTLLLRYGFTLCEDCLSICTMILEQLQLEEESSPRQNKSPQAYAKPSI